jgi:hypothetical protein
MLKPAPGCAILCLNAAGLCRGCPCNRLGAALDFAQMVDCVGASLRTNIFNENRYGTA